MRYFLLSFKAIFLKDIVTEFRSKQVLPTMIVLGMLIIWVFRIASEVASTEVSAIGPISLWVAFLFAGLLAQERSFATEEHQDCIHGLMLAPIDEGTIYLAKLLVNIIMLSIFELIIVPAAIVAFELKVTRGVPWLAAVLMLGNVGLSSVGTLFSAIVQLTRTKGALLSVMVLVILMPMMIPATFALLAVFGSIPVELIGTGALSVVGSFANAIIFMVVFDAVFVAACWLLFGFAIKE